MKPNRTIRIILRYKIMKRIIYLFFSAAAIGLFCVSPAFAAEATDDILSAFRKYKELRITQTVPSVIEISFGEYLERFDFAVIDEDDRTGFLREWHPSPKS